MNLQQIDWENYTIEVNNNTYEIPGVDVATIIPYYNRSEKNSRCISDILIRPDQKSYEEIYDSCKNEKYFSCRMRDEICGNSYLFNPKSKKDWLGIAPFLK